MVDIQRGTGKQNMQPDQDWSCYTQLGGQLQFHECQQLTCTIVTSENAIHPNGHSKVAASWATWDLDDRGAVLTLLCQLHPIYHYTCLTYCLIFSREENCLRTVTGFIYLSVLHFACSSRSNEQLFGTELVMRHRDCLIKCSCFDCFSFIYRMILIFKSKFSCAYFKEAPTSAKLVKTVISECLPS